MPEVLAGRRDVTRGVLLVSSFGAFLAFLDATIVNVAVADLRRDFPEASYADLSWVLNAYNIVFAALLVTAGRFADLLGRRRTFVAGVWVFTAASALIALAPSLGWLVAGRALQAVGSATLVPASLALVIDAFPRDRRSHAIGLWSAAAALASGLGPPLGGLLVDASGWRATFVVNLPLGAAAVWVSRTALVESRSPGKRVLPDLRGAGFVALGLGALATTLVQGPTWGWRSWQVGVGAAAAAVLLIAFARRSAWHPSPVLDPALLRRPGFAWNMVLTAVAGTGFYAYLLTHVLWLTGVWGYSVAQAGLAGAPGALLAGVVSATLGKKVDTWGARALVVPGAALWASSFGWYLATAGTSPDYLHVWLPGQVLSGFGIGLTLPVLGSAAVAAVPGGRYAGASAVASSVRQYGAVVGVSLLVVVLGSPQPADLPDALRHGWAFSAACFLAVSAGALLLRRPLPAEEDVRDDLVLSLTRPLPQALSLPPQPVPVALDTSSDVSLLRGVPLFATLSAPALLRLAVAADTLRLPAGAELFAAGDPADAVYVVRSGRLEVVRDGAVVEQLAAGGVVGELGLLTGAPRSATVRARRDSELVRLSAASFAQALDTDPAAGRALATALARRLQTWVPAASAVAPPRLVAVVPAPGAADAAEAVAAVAAGLSRLTGAPLSPPVGRAGLERLEREHSLVLLAATGHDAWRETCVRQADRVVHVARADDVPGTPAGADLGGELLLLGGLDRSGLDRWHDALRPDRVSTCDDLAAPLQALADRLTGRSVALVLSGGGARALSHLGVIAELEDAGVVIGRVAGASMGAYIGALVATGLTAEQVDARVYDEYVRRNPLGDWTLPRTALTTGRSGYAMLERSFGDLQCEQLPIGLTTSVVDLWTRELLYLSSGRVQDVVAGSLALPGISPPHLLGSRALVDGGILDNSPVAPLLARGEGPVLLSSVSDTPMELERSGEHLSVVESVLRAMTTGSTALTKAGREQASLVIAPPARGVGLLEFHQIDRMVEAGREAARAALAEAPAGLLPLRTA